MLMQPPILSEFYCCYHVPKYLENPCGSGFKESEDVETDRLMKLKCNNIQRLISDYIDDTLSTSDTAKVEKHLSYCQLCQKEVTALRKTRDLVVGFYVEPDVPDSYYYQFEVELHHCLENKGPTPISERIKSLVGQITWSLLTQLRQSFGRYRFIHRHMLPISVILLMIAAVFVMPLLYQRDPLSPEEYTGQIGKPMIAKGHTTVEEKSDVIHGMHNDYIMKQKAPDQVSSSAGTADSKEVGYWKLAEPISTETEGHIIVMHVSEDRSVPSNATDSELLVYAQPDILSKKSPLQDNGYATFPSGHPVELFLAKYQRKHRQAPRYVNKLMYEHSKIPYIPELYDLSKL